MSAAGGRIWWRRRELGDELAGDAADLAGQVGASDNGHNGSIVDVIEEQAVLEGGRR